MAMHVPRTSFQHMLKDGAKVCILVLIVQSWWNICIASLESVLAPLGSKFAPANRLKLSCLCTCSMSNGRTWWFSAFAALCAWLGRIDGHFVVDYGALVVVEFSRCAWSVFCTRTLKFNEQTGRDLSSLKEHFPYIANSNLRIFLSRSSIFILKCLLVCGVWAICPDLYLYPCMRI